jgi:hypothetical protein
MVYFHLNIHYFIPKAFTKPLQCVIFQEVSGGKKMIRRPREVQGESRKEHGRSGERR